MFKEVPAQFDFPAAERDVLAFWEKQRIYEKSLERRRGGPPFVFYEGPPTANGMPHPGHCLTRAIKDLFPRYRTMCGYFCERKAGWDTHGLPVEVEVCKELGIHSKEEIEAYGVEPFIHKCMQSVFRYTREWETLTRRLGFWVNIEEAYVTYHQSYVESVWWALKTLFEAGLLYQGHKIVWWWAQGGTALSSGEVGQGYREVDDPSVYVRFPLVMDERAKKWLGDLGLDISDFANARISLLVWTTTPWTLLSNMFAAVHPEIEYALVHDEKAGDYLIVAAELRETIAKKVKADSWTLVRRMKGTDLLGLRYVPPFPVVYAIKPHRYPAHFVSQPIPEGAMSGLRVVLEAGDVTIDEPLIDARLPRVLWVNGERKWQHQDLEYLGWRVVAADFVTLESGTGLVHEAPAFGEVDFELWREESSKISLGLPLLCAVAPDGTFTDDAPPQFRGRWVKDCDKEIIRDLKERGLLLHHELYRHDYPFCWRAEDDPLIQYPRKSWFIRTTQFKDDMLANNAAINWLPEHIKEGRFGDFLRNNVDWALSRERYWGTPLPIWVCEKTGHMEAVASWDELMSKPDLRGVEVWDEARRRNPALSEHLKVHKPYIDAITYRSPKDPTARMKRVPDVIDCWFDSGAMPFAQWGYPHADRHRFESNFPCDFLSEALDQTRGWFYSLVAISTLLFGRNGVVTRGTGLQPVRPHGNDSTEPRGTGLQPVRPESTTDVRVTSDLSRRCRTLPHWEAGGSTYFVTFRTRSGELDPQERTIVLDACRHWDGERMNLHAVVVMPDHVHMLCTPKEKSPDQWWSISELMHGIKGHTARMINRKRDTSGALWQDEYHDHIVRGEKDYQEKRSYMIANPVRRGLPRDYPWLWVETLNPDENGLQEPAAQDDEAMTHGLQARATRPDYPIPFRNCIVLGLLMGEDGLKMSKSKKNYKEPGYIFDHEGADAMRWLFFSGQAPWTSIRFQESAIADGQREFLIRLYNVYSFFVIYANIDRWTPPPFGAARLPDALGELDRWILSELHGAIRDVRAAMDAYDNFSAARRLNDFVDALSNWYVRRSRERYWRGGMDADKQAAYAVLYDCLITTTLLIAPFTPFLAETLYQNLVVTGAARGDARPPDSVHLCDYPAPDPARIDEKLSEEMAVVRDIVSLGRAARAEAKIRVRQPLPLVEIVLANPAHTAWLAAHESLFCDELNVKAVEFTAHADHYVNYQVKPNFKSLGPRFGKLAPAIKTALAKLADPAALRRQLEDRGRAPLTVDGQPIELTPEDVKVELSAKPGWTAAQNRTAVVVLRTEISDELRREGLARELVHHVQQIRKNLDLRYEQRIELGIAADAELQDVVRAFESYLAGETLAARIAAAPLAGITAHRVDIEGHAAELFVKPL
ncbi:MAG: isoleucine--tRNA ligase [Phycisphaerae bacterium]|nr:isoleucine--tRNA ligase [Phycisphaerae bacterium]NUQ45191.1 isoleucine--tRNA ligase [Phycisphaerae bacterium]